MRYITILWSLLVRSIQKSIKNIGTRGRITMANEKKNKARRNELALKNMKPTEDDNDEHQY